MIKFYGGGDYGVDFIMRMLGETKEGYLEGMKEDFDRKERFYLEIERERRGRK